MSFRDEYLWSGKTYAEWSLEQSVEVGFSKSHQLHVALANTFSENISHLQNSIATGIEKASRAGERSLAHAVQQICDHVGTELVEVRWVLERHVEVSRSILNVLLSSLANESRQFFEQGVLWYEEGEYDLAETAFNRALERSSVNYFAYQYLGFIAVVKSDPSEAIKNFDRAVKCGTTDYHRAIALAHLARAHYAERDFENAVNHAVRASRLQPQVARYAFDLAVYSAIAGNLESMKTALKRAIEIDPLFWYRAKGETAFRPIFEAVEEVLAEVEKAEQLLNKQTIEVFRRMEEISISLPEFVQKVGERRSTYETMLCSGDVGLYRDIRKRAAQEAIDLCRELNTDFENSIKSLEDEYFKQREVIEAPLRRPRTIRDFVAALFAPMIEKFDREDENAIGCFLAVLWLSVWPLTAGLILVLICAASLVGIRGRKLRTRLSAALRLHNAAVERAKTRLQRANEMLTELSSRKADVRDSQ
jgi:tetratricopeptide (TPR) repeat protein